MLERSALVESLATKVIVSKAPIAAIHGPFGDGKSSVLNPLKRTLEPLRNRRPGQLVALGRRSPAMFRGERSDKRSRLRRATLIFKNADTAAASSQFFKLETRMCDSYDPKAA
jgi:hypothetical protein